MTAFGQEGVIVGVQVTSPELERFRHTLNRAIGEPVPEDDLVIPLITTAEIPHYDEVDTGAVAATALPVARALDRACLEGSHIDVEPRSLTPNSPYVSIRLRPTDELAYAKDRAARILSREVGHPLSTSLTGLWLNLLETSGEPDEARINVANRMRRLPAAVFVTSVINRLGELDWDDSSADDFAQQELAQGCRPVYRNHQFTSVAFSSR